MAEVPGFRDNGFPDINVEELTALDEPNYDQMRDDRMQRTGQAMRAVDAGLTSQLLPECGGAARLSAEDRAAVVIQKHFRGHLGRKVYIERLFLKFEEEERQREAKMMQQVEEGELLVDNHKLEVLLDEGQTVRRNRDRQHICKVITIQRAWRAHRDRKQQTPHPPSTTPRPPSTHSVTTTTHPHHHHHNYRHHHHHKTAPPGDENDDDILVIDRVINLDDIHIVDDDDVDDDDGEDSETESAVQTMTLSTPEENQNSAAAAAALVEATVEAEAEEECGGGEIGSRLSSFSSSFCCSSQLPHQQQHVRPVSAVSAPFPPVLLKSLQDSECESLASDYSELGAGPLRELEKDLELVDREQLKNYTPDFQAPGTAATTTDPHLLLLLHSTTSLTSSLDGDLTAADSLQRQPGESDDDYNRRLRKLNYLSLAQEFAQLKRVNADACPIDFHLSQSGYSSRSASSLSLDKVSDAAVLSEQQQGVLGDPSSAMDNNHHHHQIPDRGRPPPRGGSGGGGGVAAPPLPSSAAAAAVMMRDISARRSLRSRGREGSAKRNSHHGGTPSRDLAAGAGGGGLQGSGGQGSGSGPERPLSQPVAVMEGSGGGGDFEVFTMDSSLPTMNWELLERQLQLAAEDERNRLEARQTDREEIRRKLAMGCDEDYYGGERAFKKPSLSTRLQGGMNLQICFVNDAAATADDTATATAGVEVTSAGTTATSCTSTNTATTTNNNNNNSMTVMSSSSVMTGSSQSHHNLSSASTIESSASITCSSSSSLSGAMSSTTTVSSSSSSAIHQSQTSVSTSKNRPKSDPGLLASQMSLPPSDESIAERQQRLQQEARMALAQASNMARMQLEVERKTKKKSPIADIVGVPELGDGRRLKLSRKLLQEMNLAQLQVLVNDLHSQIESLNEELVHLLMERDDLHMEQDSMLVDIEDLTR
ncbi:uncharacterized protein LOC143289262 isoform X2 [Babylonia areolata]|uniref:uncharacterized protein LOC143289262 isoform X2 n=1 Tax=Babylonia areolata TaxID=304850 RepID=UPI003FD25D9A